MKAGGRQDEGRTGQNSVLWVPCVPSADRAAHVFSPSGRGSGGGCAPVCVFRLDPFHRFLFPVDNNDAY